MILTAICLFSGGVLSAQPPGATKVHWPASEGAATVAGDVKPAPLPIPNIPEIKTVTFTRPPINELRHAAQPAMLRQAPPGQFKPPAEPGYDVVIRTELPGVDLIFTRESESQLFDTIRAENQARPGAQRVIFPERGQVTRDKYAGRSFKQMVETVEPSFVMHRRLNFEAINADRYGWEIGNLQPAISLGHFMYDMVALPYHTWTRPLQKWDSSAGRCLPGDNVPLMFYREPFSVTGLAAQTGAVFLGLAAFP